MLCLTIKSDDEIVSPFSPLIKIQDLCQPYSQLSEDT